MTVERVVRDEPAGEAKYRRHGLESWVEAAGRSGCGRRVLDRRGALASRQLRFAARAVEERTESMVALTRLTCGYGGIFLVS